jgi:Uma2 family endonuclease
MATTMPSTGRPLAHYTIDELEALELPDNGVRYELVHGQLLVSPFPKPWHQIIAARLLTELNAYVDPPAFGKLASPGVIFVGDDSELQPDILAFAAEGIPTHWRAVTAWWLAVEVLSPSTRKMDLTVKREAYLEFGVQQLWFVDPELDTVTIVRRGAPDVVLRSPDKLRWQAPGAHIAVTIDLAGIFAR